MALRILKRFWLAAAAVALLAVGAALFYLFRSPNLQPAEADGISSGGPLLIPLGINADPILLAEKTTLAPAAPFRWVVEDGRAFLFPVYGFQPGTSYRLVIAPGQIGVNGERLSAPISNEFTIRSPRLLYMALEDESLDLWLYDPVSETPSPLTDGGGLYDYDVEQSGERVVFSQVNVLGGYDLWLLDLSAVPVCEARLLVDCGTQICINPAFNPTGNWLAYTRMQADQFAGNTGLGWIWTVQTDTGETAQLFQDPAVYGVNPQWSPDGTVLSFYDHSLSGIRIVKVINGEQFFLSTSAPAALGWRPEADYFLYSDYEPNSDLPVMVFVRGDLQKTQPAAISASMDRAFDLSTPAISPRGDVIVAGVRLVEGPPVYQLWLFDLEGNQLLEITRDFTYTHGWYSWSPDGSALAFQRYKFGSADNKPEVVIWERESGELKVVQSGAGFPTWLP